MRALAHADVNFVGDGRGVSCGSVERRCREGGAATRAVFVTRRRRGGSEVGTSAYFRCFAKAAS
jgi:hypothetical protein